MKNTRVWASFFVVLVGVLLFGFGCNKNKNCVETPVGPSCGNGNGPGPSVLASVRHATYIGGCPGGNAPANTAACSGELLSAGGSAPQDSETTLEIKKGQFYTFEACTDHPGVRGRKIDMYVGMPAKDATQDTKIQRFEPIFDEGNTAYGSPVCVSASFIKNDGGSTMALIQFVEGNGDLRTPNERIIRVIFVIVR